MIRTEKIRVLDPTEGPLETIAHLAPRLPALDGKRFAFINNGKRNSNVLLESLVEEIKNQHQIQEIVWIDKKNASLPIGEDMLKRIKSCHAVIAGVGD